MKIEFPDEYLAAQWDGVNWPALEEKLADVQEELSLAAYYEQADRVTRLQKRIVRELDFKLLAVRHVTSANSGPGVDGVRWLTSAEKMRAAISLTSKNYAAQPMREIVMVAKNTGKQRHAGLPVYYDRAMNVLYGYSLLPVAEAKAERKSFAFRPGRSIQDAVAYVIEALKGKDAPSIIVVTDVHAFYASIEKAWLLEHIPMDKKMLREFLNSGVVFAGELFPEDDYGISEGSSLSPYLGNIVLDGLQKHLYRSLFGTEHPSDYRNGNLVRFADDLFIQVRTREQAALALEAVEAFLAARGLTLSRDKTWVGSLDEGFTYLGFTFRKQGDYIYHFPSQASTERFIADIKSVIQNHRRSQRELIRTLNQKLRGRAAYYRFSDARESFRRIDTAVQAALLDAAMRRHPKMPRKKVIDTYWFEEGDGGHSYALPDDKSTKVMRLEDTLLLEHRKVKTNLNPFLERAYVEARTHERAIHNVTGAYKGIWKRQDGRCFYCGRPILPDQPRAIVPLSLAGKPSIKNSAYIHRLCQESEYELLRRMEDESFIRPYDILSELQDVQELMQNSQTGRRQKKPIPEDWRHMPLKRYLAKKRDAHLRLSFSDIERIDGRPLPKSARKNKDWWYPRQNCNMIAEAWCTEGYRLKTLDLEREYIFLARVDERLSSLRIPDAISGGKLPDNAVFELENFFAYITKKYGL